jgi:hypothetical protein
MAIVIWDGTGGAAHGKAGNSVYVRTKYGTVLRSAPLPSEKTSPAKAAQQKRFGQAVEVYRSLDAAENAAWAEFAVSPLNHNPDTNKQSGITAYNAFMGLATRFLMVSPDAAIPRTPPAFPFAGDPLTFSLATQPEQIVITASSANSAHVVTELLLHPVKFPTRSVRVQDFVSAALVRFTPNDLIATLDLPAGWYRVATRFLDATTGQATYRQLYNAVQVMM